jgi:hypothetical protein
MARGWESKSIEGQQEEASRKREPAGPREAAATDGRRSLELARARTAALLAAARTEMQRRTLEAALADLDERLRTPAGG